MRTPNRNEVAFHRLTENQPCDLPHCRHKAVWQILRSKQDGGNYVSCTACIKECFRSGQPEAVPFLEMLKKCPPDTEFKYE
jgi:hypothetical protein